MTTAAWQRWTRVGVLAAMTKQTRQARMIGVVVTEL
jgi:CobQ-like glutamine amidotransferase family enzyme